MAFCVIRWRHLADRSVMSSYRAHSPQGGVSEHSLAAPPKPIFFHNYLQVRRYCQDSMYLYYTVST